MTPDKDAIYATPRERIEAFRFDDSVASVFPDMIARSVPGYGLTLEMIAVAARRYALPDSNCYDLGCSLGASTLQIRHNAPPGCRVIGVDNAPAMAERCRTLVTADACDIPVEIRCEDILDTSIERASLVALNFTLQFVALGKRLAMLERINRAMLDGGCLILSEKIAFDDPHEQKLLQELHHAYKQLHGYSALEVAQKRSALENVLIPETLDAHRERLRAAGFERVTVWMQCLNFISLLAQK